MAKGIKNGPELWKRAKSIIPGGNQLLSKRSERFLPGLWPAYYQKAKGCRVWTLDGKVYYDFAQMGVGSCILGYADFDVDRAVKNAIAQGSMSSLNCPEEVDLAEVLIALHPWAQMVRFSRTGGEACSIAVRIARAASGKDKVLFCGYHGWHDWYLGANLGDTAQLDGHLLPGLHPKGVPRGLKDSAFAFSYNDTGAFDRLVSLHGAHVGAIIMEPLRSSQPKPGFLEHIRSAADKLGAVLIFDEVTSGFRMNLGGIHMTFGVEPDIAVFGKGMGNGYAISAVIGRKNVMDAAQDTFISSTMWTERIGFAAALATIKKMRACHVQEHLVQYGDLINAGWSRIAQETGLDIHMDGISPLTHLTFKTPEPLAVQTLYAQEMLAKQYLLGASVYSTYAYSKPLIQRFIRDSKDVFRLIKKAIKEGSVKRYLKSDVIQPGFARLT